MSPQSVTNHLDRASLTIRWLAGDEMQISHATLRAACTCTACDQMRRLGWGPAVEPGVRLLALQLVGRQGVLMVFNDGHGQGVYPWRYLRALAGAGRVPRRGDLRSPPTARAAR